MSIQAEFFEGSDGQTRRVFRVDANDNSPLCIGQFASRCGSCFLGHTHSQALHDLNTRPEGGCEITFPWAKGACPNPAETKHDGEPACFECADELREIERESE
jgi:hypothetical protein